jgi:plastocyanin
MRNGIFTAVVLAGALVAANCGGGGGASTPTSPSTSTGGSTSTPTVVTITIKGVEGKNSFDPNPANVGAGQLVAFKNSDVVTHHVMLDDGSLQTQDIAPGATSGTLPVGALNTSYHCSIHPSMVGSFNSAATPDPPPCTGYCG